MIDLDRLDPALMAKQLGCPEGEIGLAIADRMNRANAALTDAVYRHLALEPGNRILEIGFGNGKLVPRLFDREAALTYAGIDISETMVAAAAAFNRGLTEAGRASFRLASVDDIPFPDRSFERAVTTNTIYFWPDPVRALAEIRRILCPAGILVLAASTPESAAKLPYTRHGFRLYDEERLRTLHDEAGFESVDLDRFRKAVTMPDGSFVDREHMIVIARA